MRLSEIHHDIADIMPPDGLAMLFGQFIGYFLRKYDKLTCEITLVGPPTVHFVWWEEDFLSPGADVNDLDSPFSTDLDLWAESKLVLQDLGISASTVRFTSDSDENTDGKTFYTQAFIFESFPEDLRERMVDRGLRTIYKKPNNNTYHYVS